MCGEIAMMTNLLAKRLALSCCLVFVTAVAASAQCVPPRYHVGFQEDLPSEAYAQISIAIHDFSPRPLVCLATALKRRYRDRPSIQVFIFSSSIAAKYFRFWEYRGDSTSKPVEG